MSPATEQSASRRFLALHTVVVVLVHVLTVGTAVVWWGIQWLPQYFEFHENRGFLNPDLVHIAKPWFEFLSLGSAVGILCAVGLVVLDITLVFWFLKSKCMQWFTDVWSSLVIVLPLFFVLVSGTKMLESYWGIEERIAQQKQGGVGQRARDSQNILGTWVLVAWEKDGSRETKEKKGFELTIETDGYRWKSSSGECLGGWDVYSSSTQNEMCFVPNEINENAWGGNGYYRVTRTRLALHLVNEPGFFKISSFDSRTGGELWIFKRK